MLFSCQSADGVGHVPPGEGGKYIGTSYAFGVLSNLERGGGQNKPGEREGETGDLCGNYKLQDSGKRGGRDGEADRMQRKYGHFYLSGVPF